MTRRHETAAVLALAALGTLAVLLLPARRACAQSTAQKQPLVLSFEIRGWLPFVFDGMFKIHHEDHEGTAIGWDRDLNVNQTPEIFEMGFTIGDVRYGRIVLGWCDFSTSGNKVLIRDLWYNGVLFHGPGGGGTLGETVHTDLEFAFHRIAVQTVQNVGGSDFIGLDVGVVLFDFKGKLTKRTFASAESEDNYSRTSKADAQLPLTGLFSEFNLGAYFKLQVGVAGVFLQATKTEVSLTEFYVRFDFFPAPYLITSVGYRYWDVEASIDLSNADDGELEISTHGFVLALGLKI